MAFTETILMIIIFGISAIGLAIIFAIKKHYDRKIDESNARMPTL